LILGALAYGLRILVQNGRVTWPPDQLLGSLSIVAGCLALIGPVLLFRRSSEGGVGELVWLTGGLLIWVYDLAGLSRGDWRSLAWATPLGPQAMGLTVLALMIAGWRWRSGGGNWRWTNVVGWSLGLFWITAAFIAMTPTRSLLLSVR
jgi:hypothetical protein